MTHSFIEYMRQLEVTALAEAIRSSTWLFPTLETLHVLAIVLVVGTIAVVDLRIMGLASRDQDVTRLIREVLPYTWVSFVLAVVSGGLMFISSAVTYATNLPFLTKLLFLLLAGVNMAVFHVRARENLQRVQGTRTPASWRLAGTASLVFWAGAIVAGRWIGFSA